MQALSAADAHAARLAPELIYIPPPAPGNASGLGRAALVLVALMALGFVIVAAVAPFFGVGYGLLPLLVVVVSSLTVFLMVRSERKYSRTYAASLAAAPVSENPALDTRLRGLWARMDMPPPPYKVTRLAGEVLPGDRARLVCLGWFRLPPIGDYRFEADILTPTRLVWRKFRRWSPWLACLGLYLGAQAGVLPGHLHFIREWCAFAVLGGLGALLLFFDTAAAPQYARIAPGVIPPLRFWRRAKPNIYSFPLVPGTLAVLINPSRQVNSRRSELLLFVGGEAGYSATLNFVNMRNGGEVLERVLLALRSTAPIPPLSEEELVG